MIVPVRAALRGPPFCFLLMIDEYRLRIQGYIEDQAHSLHLNQILGILEDLVFRSTPVGLVIGLALLALAHPPRVGHTFALDLDTDLVPLAALFAHEVVVRGIAKEMFRKVATLNTTTLASRLHSGGEVDGITKEAVPRHLISNDAGNDRTRGQTSTDEDLLSPVGAVGLDEFQGVESKESNLLGSLSGDTAIGSTADDHIGVSVKYNVGSRSKKGFV